MEITLDEARFSLYISLAFPRCYGDEGSARVADYRVLAFQWKCSARGVLIILRPLGIAAGYEWNARCHYERCKFYVHMGKRRKKVIVIGGLLYSCDFNSYVRVLLLFFFYKDTVTYYLQSLKK